MACLNRTHIYIQELVTRCLLNWYVLFIGIFLCGFLRARADVNVVFVSNYVSVDLQSYYFLTSIEARIYIDLCTSLMLIVGISF